MNYRMCKLSVFFHLQITSFWCKSYVSGFFTAKDRQCVSYWKCACMYSLVLVVNSYELNALEQKYNCVSIDDVHLLRQRTQYILSFLNPYPLKRAFAYSWVKIFNSLPKEIKNTKSLSLSRKKIFYKYFNSQIIRCYFIIET